MLETLKNLHKTFYDSRFYRDLVFKWTGFGFGFLLVISVVNTGQLVVMIAEPYKIFMQEREAIFNSLPEIEIRNGKILSQNETPQTISIMQGIEGGPIRIIIDTKSEMTDEAATAKQMEAEQILAIVNSNAVSLYNPADKQLEVKKASDMPNNKITHEKWDEISKMLASGFMPATIFFVFCINLMGYLITGVLGAILLLVICPLFKTNLNFQAAMRLSSAAKVPVAVVFLVVMPQLTLQALLWFGFAVFGLFSAKKGGNPAGQPLS